jgi:hypothetical protein
MLTVMYCPLCNWKSKEMAVSTQEWRVRVDKPYGTLPCGTCKKPVRHYIEYAEDNREEALRQLNKLL